MSEYQGWANRTTWNVALYINNEYQIYKWACDFMKDYKGNKPYQDFIDAYGLISTPDGYLYNSKAASRQELNDMMKEMVD
jgi:hypothetical protein